jgi:hypothetical protein
MSEAKLTLQRFEEAIPSETQLAAGDQITLQPISWDELTKPPDSKKALLENRVLEEDQGMLMFGPAGCGKSVLGFQMCACWSCGMSGVHIAPQKPLRIVVLQTEDSENDLREYCDGILSQKIFTTEKIALLKQNLLVMEPVPGGSPDYLRELLLDAAQRFKPNLISLNPLLAFCSADYTRELGTVLYQVIDPIIKRYHIGFLGVIHTTKPIYRDTSGFGAYDYQYLAAGDARTANWPRFSIQLDPVATNPVVTACLRITKRWQRLRWLNEHGEPTHERYIKHSSSGKIWWEDASQEEADSARGTEDAKKILEILPSPSESGIIREEVRIRAKNELAIGKGKTDDWLKIGVHNGFVDRYAQKKLSRIEKPHCFVASMNNSSLRFSAPFSKSVEKRRERSKKVGDSSRPFFSFLSALVARERRDETKTAQKSFFLGAFLGRITE